MTDKKKYVAAAAGPWSDTEWLNLWEVEELCRVARREGLPDESEFRCDYDKTFMRTRYSVTHDPSKRRVDQMAPLRTPVEQAIESGGKRLLELRFIRHSDVREPVTIRIQVQDDSTNIVMTSLELTEHQFALLLSGQVIKVEDSP